MGLAIARQMGLDHRPSWPIVANHEGEVLAEGSIPFGTGIRIDLRLARD